MMLMNVPCLQGHVPSSSLLTWLLMLIKISEAKSGTPPNKGCRYQCPQGKCVSGPYSSCPNGCLQNQKKCADGSCKFRLEICGCSGTFMKKCKDGTCVKIFNACPGECGGLQSFACDDGQTCLSLSDKCNGFTQCQDGTDEPDNCLTFNPPTKRTKYVKGPNLSRTEKIVVGVVVFVVLPIFYAIYYGCKKCLNAQEEAPHNPFLSEQRPHRPSSSSAERLTYERNSPYHFPIASRVSTPASSTPRAPSPVWVQHILDNSVSPPGQTELDVTNRTPLLPTEGDTVPTAPPPGYNEAVRDSHFEVTPQENNDTDLPSYDAVAHVLPTSGTEENEQHFTSTQV